MYLNLVKPFDTGWNLFARPIKEWCVERFEDTLEQICSTAIDIFEFCDLGIAWMIIVSLLLLKDGILYWLYHLPSQVRRVFMYFGFMIIFLEAWLWNNVNLFAPAWYFVSGVGFLIKCLPPCAPHRLGYSSCNNYKKRLNYHFRYHGKLLKHGHIPTMGPNCIRKWKPSRSSCKQVDQEDDNNDDDVGHLSLISRIVEFFQRIFDTIMFCASTKPCRTASETWSDDTDPVPSDKLRSDTVDTGKTRDDPDSPKTDKVKSDSNDTDTVPTRKNRSDGGSSDKNRSDGNSSDKTRSDGENGYFKVPWWLHSFIYYSNLRRIVRESYHKLTHLSWWCRLRLSLNYPLYASQYLAWPTLLSTSSCTFASDDYYNVIDGCWSDAIVFGTDATPATEWTRFFSPLYLLPLPSNIPSLRHLIGNICPAAGRSG